jgi:CBS domain-containing protein
VSQLEGEPRSARAEALITAVGPLTSLVLAAIAYALGALLSGSASLALLGHLLAWLAYINLALGLFNLVPAFPLDGGRLLSSIFWWRTGSRSRGLHQAVRVGRFFAYGMIGIGLLELFLGSVLNGVWLAFLGWFLLSAAASEDAGATARELLRRVPVSAAMSAPVITVPDWMTVERFLASEAPRHTFTTYPVHDESGRISGVVRLRELIDRRQPGWAERRLSDFAHPLSEIAIANPNEDLAGLLDRVGAQLDRRVLVFSGDQLVGIVSPADLARLVAVRQSLERRGRPEPG